MVDTLDRSRWLPLSADRLTVQEALPDGTVRGFLGRLRVIRTPAGGIQRANTLLPVSRPGTEVVKLPARLGGGFLFVTFGATTELHRAPTFLAPTSRIANTSALGGEGRGVVPVPGPGSLFLRFRETGRVTSLDAATGEPLAIKELPPLPNVTAMHLRMPTGGSCSAISWAGC